MLVLTRQRDEAVVITTPSGERIKVVILGLRGKGSELRARIGIDAPQSVVIHREEVQEKLDRRRSDD